MHRYLSVLVASLSLVGCSSVSGSVGWPVDHGRFLAQEKCASCHTIAGRGASPNPKAPAFADIGKNHSPKGLDRELEMINEMGHYDMPTILLSRSERDGLAAYIQNRLPGA